MIKRKYNNMDSNNTNKSFKPASLNENTADNINASEDSLKNTDEQKNTSDNELKEPLIVFTTFEEKLNYTMHATPKNTEREIQTRHKFIDLELLAEMFYNNIPLLDISKELGVSTRRVLKIVHMLELKRKRSDVLSPDPNIRTKLNKKVPDDIVVSLYVNKGYSIKETADALGCGMRTVFNIVSRLGVKRASSWPMKISDEVLNLALGF